MLRALSALIGGSLLCAAAAHGAAADIIVRSDGADIRSGSWFMRVTALTDDILRVRAAAAGNLPEDASWAVPAEMRGRSVHVTIKQDADGIDFKTATLAVRIARSPLRLIVSDLSGHVISADTPARALETVDGGFLLRKELTQKEHIFGLGDKAGPLDRRGQAFTLWNTDAYRFQESTDPLYKSIPFFIAFRAGAAAGVFLDNTWRSSFDFGKVTSGIYSFGAVAGPIDYYLFYGPSPKQVVETYAWLTGTPPLPPLWAFGFQQSRYSYMSQARVLEVAKRFRSDSI